EGSTSTGRWTMIPGCAHFKVRDHEAAASRSLDATSYGGSFSSTFVAPGRSLSCRFTARANATACAFVVGALAPTELAGTNVAPPAARAATRSDRATLRRTGKVTPTPARHATRSS